MQSQYSKSDLDIYYRLIALWILCEAALGGIIHGLRVPVSGLFVGGAAVVCISLIAWFNPGKGAILKATIIVAIFKMMLSPQAPVTAYVAVFLQGLLGELLFWKRRYFRIVCLLFAVLAMLESGIQRILIVTIIYGNDIWTATNEFFARLFPRTKGTNYSYVLGVIYISAHLLAGILIGLAAGLVPYRYKKWTSPSWQSESTEIVVSGKKRSRRLALIIIWLLLILLLIQSNYGPRSPVLPENVALKILVRSLAIVLGWLLVLSPLLKMILNSWLQRKSRLFSKEISTLTGLLPGMKVLVLACWKNTEPAKGMSRIGKFIKMLLAGILKPSAVGRKIIIISGEIDSGKTTYLRNELKNLEGAGGIISPKEGNYRTFIDVYSGDQFPMEANDKDRDPILVGRHRFSRSNFERAGKIIRAAIENCHWVVIDEIGPLELKEQGFYEELCAAVASGVNIIIVVRRGLLQEVRNKFQLNEAIIINPVMPGGLMKQIEQGTEQ